MTGIRKCEDRDFEKIFQIINEAAQAYKGVIPADRWKEPYMSRTELEEEVRDGVNFWGYELDGKLVGVIGVQDLKDVTLIRHAYVRRENQRQGIGNKLLSHLVSQAKRPVLIGTWADAAWAIQFYTRNGFSQVPRPTKEILLRKYWSIPERQVETSVVLADKKWTKSNPELARGKS